jgi:hypothetical protein
MLRAFALSLLFSSPALACAVCGAGDEPQRGAYVVMSVVISLLPLAMLGGIVGYVVLKSRAGSEQPEPGKPVER